MGEFREAIPPRRKLTGRKDGGQARIGTEAAFALGLALGVFCFLIVAAVFMYQVVYADRVYLGVSAMEADLGGDTSAEARARLAARLDQYSATPITLRYRSNEWKATPSEVGIRFDVDRVVNTAYQAGRAGTVFERLAIQLAIWRTGVVLRPVLSWDQAQKDVFLSRLARQIDQPTVDARIIVQPDLQVRVAPSQAGRRLNATRTTDALEQAFATLETAPIDIVVDESQPRVVDAAAQEPKAAAEKMLSAPLVLTYDNRSWKIESREIQGMITFVQQDEGPASAKLIATLEQEKLKSFIINAAAEIDRKPQNARFNYSGGKLTVIRDSIDGLKVDVPGAINAVKRHAASDQRTVILPVEVIKPSVQAQDAGALGAIITEKVEDASTSYAGSVPERKTNVELATKRLHGVVVGPGEIFSFNEELGPATIEAGFQTAWGILLREGNMETVPSEAGGICQVSTTLFHAVFWAGYQIEERLWHLYWIPRYGVPPKGLKGLDSTVDSPYVDFKFKNNTPYPILIQTRSDGQNINFAIYGKKPSWRVKIDQPIIENVVKASTETVREEDPTRPVGWSLWTEHAEDGFKATVVRTVTDGNDVRTLRLISEYRPSRNVLRVGTKPVPGQPPQQPPGQPQTPQQSGPQQPAKPQPQPNR